MAILLIILGVFSVFAGLGMITYGIPVKEFSWGNTLILSGTTAVVGGVIVIGLGLAIRQLRQIAEVLASRPLDMAHAPSELPSVLTPPLRHPAATARVPFPPKPRRDVQPETAEQSASKPVSPPIPPVADVRPLPEAVPAVGEDRDHRFETIRRAEPVVAPGPADAPPVTASSPSTSGADNADISELPGIPRGSLAGDQPLPSPETPRRPPWLEAAGRVAPGGFDSVWKAEPPPAAVEPEPAGAFTDDASPSAPDVVARAPRTGEPHEEPRAVAILKSGVIDGMGYTLYVDGSIEAELPQGTVHFDSIADLREHLEKNP
jgi:hypothetical protein